MPSIPRQTLYLIGMPGCGKSATGRTLSHLLDRPFTDLDLFIEEQEGASIPVMFKHMGEPYFREKERDYLRKIEGEHHIVATGGGAPCFFDNIDFMLQSGLVVFLHVGVEELTKRISQSKQPRPHFDKLSQEEILAQITERFQLRKPFYTRAHITIDCTSLSVKEVAESVIAKLRGI